MPTRRAFLTDSALAAAATAAAACTETPSAKDTGDSAGDTASGSMANAGTLPDDALDPITTNEAFYHVSISTEDYSESELAAWTITLQNVAGDTVALSMDDLRALVSEDYERTITCISSHDGQAIGNAVWTTVRLTDVLAAVGLDRDGDYVWIEAASGYSTCLPASDLDAGLRLVFGMNGVDLPVDHGGPVRILTPGRYGMKNPKWVTRIAFSAEHLDGFWEAYGWSDAARNQIQAWFLSPLSSTTVTATDRVTVQGCAFAGLSGISRVEVSADDGATWSDAELTYAGGPDVWTLWSFSADIAAAGAYTFKVRATDGSGTLQPDTETVDSGLDGLEKWASVTVTVLDA